MWVKFVWVKIVWGQTMWVKIVWGQPMWVKIVWVKTKVREKNNLLVSYEGIVLF